MIAVVDYGRGNLHSVISAFKSIGEDVFIASSPDDLDTADRIVLPGVGAFPAGMRILQESGMVDSLTYQVKEKEKPFLGICLGMHFLANSSDEGSVTSGLGWIDAKVKELPVRARGFKLPHVGWNETFPVTGSQLFSGMRENPIMYYLHSYAIAAETNEDIVDAYCCYGERFVAAIRYRNVAAVQFHPEKSQQMGIKFLMNWSEWSP